MSWFGRVKCRVCGYLFFPCVLWGFIPPLDELWMMATFGMTQMILYTLDHLRGMLFLATLVLILWTKNIIRRWYRKQMLTIDFFGKMLYMLATGIVSLLAAAYLWLPLYEAYACVFGKMDEATFELAMYWRDIFFVVFAIILVLSAASNTDIVLKASRIDEAGMKHVLHRLGSRIVKLVCSTTRALGWCLRSSCRSMKSLNCTLAKVTRNPYAAVKWPLRKCQGRTSPSNSNSEMELDVHFANMLRRPTSSRPQTRAGRRAASERSLSVVVSTSQLLKECVSDRTADRQSEPTRRRSSGSVVRCVTPVISEDDAESKQSAAVCNLRPQGRCTVVVDKSRSSTSSATVTRSRARMVTREGKENKKAGTKEEKKRGRSCSRKGKKGGRSPSKKGKQGGRSLSRKGKGKKGGRSRSRKVKKRERTRSKEMMKEEKGGRSGTKQGGE
ncbi:uncharacterized protein [Littorina saxatilis]|uniref:uncharacterized protein isoform X2 n=1 Tax=Littorina saxatilis TaxID=31220 RepID=UPI0038B444B3